MNSKIYEFLCFQFCLSPKEGKQTAWQAGRQADFVSRPGLTWSLPAAADPSMARLSAAAADTKTRDPPPLTIQAGHGPAQTASRPMLRAFVWTGLYPALTYPGGPSPRPSLLTPRVSFAPLSASA